MTGTATYSPEDNKLRLYPDDRLDPDLYQRVRSAGFIWAPKQELFVAPAWTPAREDLLIELCGEIDDEDKSLVERAEERADRFTDYAGRRAQDADQAHKAVDAIADNIPLGQPILVGHHSERHARRDAEKIENGMRRAIRLWDESKYWAERAKGAIRNAKYKELPAVRARRIKGLEADRRRLTKEQDRARDFLKMWTRPDKELTLGRAKAIANYDRVSKCFTLAEYPRQEPASQYEGMQSLWSALDSGIITAEQAREIAARAHERTIAQESPDSRTIRHIDNRLTYERAMLAESGGLITDKHPDIKQGGRVLARGEWLTILRVNKSGGQVVSLTTNRRYVSRIGVEEVKDYTLPTAGQFHAVRQAVKLSPICNYPGPGFLHMTKAEYQAHYNIGTRAAATGTEDRYYIFPKVPDGCGPHRLYCKHKGGPGLDCHNPVPVYFTDQKRKDPPPATTAAELPEIPEPERDANAPERPHYQQPERTKFDDLRDTLKAGVQVVTAPSLFPTPPELARRMVEAAGLDIGQTVLEPSAGTGNIARAIRAVAAVHLDCIEVNPGVCRVLKSQGFDPIESDFLTVEPGHVCPDSAGGFDRVIMNPPFERGADIEHIRHALTFLKPGGRLVAICANGPRQQRELGPLATTWTDLEPGTFKDSGTNVNTAMITIQR